VKPGAIAAERVSRRFRVYPQRSLTLKERIIRRRHLEATEIWALRDVSVSVAAGESVGLIGRNGSGKTTLLRLIAGIFRPTEGTVAVGGSVGSLLGLGAGFHPEFTGRENVYLNAAIHGLPRAYIREQMDEIVSFAELERFVDLPVRTYSAGMYMRLGFAIAMHLNPDVLLLDEVFAVGDEAFQQKCFGKIFEYKSGGGTIVFVSHSAAAVELLCERAVLLKNGSVEYDGDTNDAMTLYHRMLAAEENPAERAVGLQEWGSGEAQVTAVRFEDADGNERHEYLAGEPLVLRLRVEAREQVPPPRVQVEVHVANGPLLGVASHEIEDGWSDGSGERWLRFELERLPLAAGRFQIHVALAEADGVRLYHRRERAGEFLVYPHHEVRGPILFDGQWTVETAPAEVETA
jgi:ABC-type polysaccharide/polyol phosphate transport system ATPase subunit